MKKIKNKRKKTKIEVLRELLKDPKAREMIENTDKVAGHLVNGDQKCNI